MKKLFVLILFLCASVVWATPPTRPNILLFLTDDQTMYSLAQMPYLSSLPHGDWVQFSNAFFSTPLCCPTRATILTGRQAYTVGILANTGVKFPDSETLAVWLQRIGYRTSLIGKYLNNYPWLKGNTYIPPGWTDWHVIAGNVQYYKYYLNDNGVISYFGTTAAEYQTDVINQRALTFLGTQSDSPFFLEVSYYAPHYPTTSAPRHSKAAVVIPPLPPNFNEADVSDKPAWVRALPLVDPNRMNNYYRKEMRAMLAVDESIHSIIDTLASDGRFDNTIVIFMTDNGYSRGSHRWDGKGAPYEEPIRTPLLIRYPGGGNRTETRLAVSVDINPTITELTGAIATLSPHGMSLVPVLEDTATSWRNDFLISLRQADKNHNYWGVRTLEYKYVELDTGERELYDLVADPYEMDNVAGHPEYATIQTDLATRVQELKLAAH